MGVFILLNVVIVALKLYSFIHFWYDVRKFIENKKRLIRNDAKSIELQENLYQKIEEVISNYPKNLSFKGLFTFMFMPVLCYQIEYPRTERIRKRYLAYYLIQFFICNFLGG
jgi:hypothetical protein